MGIQGLLPLLKPVTSIEHIQLYRNKRIAVDTYGWLHKATYGCCVEMCTGKLSSNRWVQYCLSYIDLLLKYDIEVFLVFDGGSLPAKKSTELERAEKRRQNLEKGWSCMNRGDHNGARQHFSRAVDVTPRMAAELIKICKQTRPSVTCIVAPYEADAQLAYLSINNLVDAVISEDSDTIPFGCSEVLFKLEKDGSCQRIILNDIYTKPINGFDFIQFNSDMMIYMCIISGCDYLASVPGMGIKTSYKLISKYKTSSRILRALRLQGNMPIIPVPAIDNNDDNDNDNDSSCTSSQSSCLVEYELGFYKALTTFKHQTVFDTIARKSRSLFEMNLNDMELCLRGRSLEYLGVPLEDRIISAIADGFIDPVTYEPFDLSEHLEFPLSQSQSKYSQSQSYSQTQSINSSFQDLKTPSKDLKSSNIHNNIHSPESAFSVVTSTTNTSSNNNGSSADRSGSSRNHNRSAYKINGKDMNSNKENYKNNENSNDNDSGNVNGFFSLHMQNQNHHNLNLLVGKQRQGSVIPLLLSLENNNNSDNKDHGNDNGNTELEIDMGEENGDVVIDMYSALDESSSRSRSRRRCTRENNKEMDPDQLYDNSDGDDDVNHSNSGNSTSSSASMLRHKTVPVTVTTATAPGGGCCGGGGSIQKSLTSNTSSTTPTTTTTPAAAVITIPFISLAMTAKTNHLHATSTSTSTSGIFQREEVNTLKRQRIDTGTIPRGSKAVKRPKSIAACHGIASGGSSGGGGTISRFFNKQSTISASSSTSSSAVSSTEKAIALVREIRRQEASERLSSIDVIDLSSDDDNNSNNSKSNIIHNVFNNKLDYPRYNSSNSSHMDELWERWPDSTSTLTVTDDVIDNDIMNNINDDDEDNSNNNINSKILEVNDSYENSLSQLTDTDTNSSSGNNSNSIFDRFSYTDKRPKNNIERIPFSSVNKITLSSFQQKTKNIENNNINNIQIKKNMIHVEKNEKKIEKRTFYDENKENIPLSVYAYMDMDEN